MVVESNEIRQVTQDVWGSVLGLPVEQSAPQEGHGKPESWLTGCVQITGAWEGAITVESSTALARRATSILLGVEAEAATMDDIHDALGELTNIIGGNIKSMLPGPSQLSLPAVVDGLEFSLTVPGSHLLSKVVFDCEGQPLRVALLMRDENQCHHGKDDSAR